ncbi:hypothetical protein F9C07_780 [Aspergillus flavus]|uniref:Uncharacterized protein n=1 Tax=Aspergillus flavus (strain ATCC 200026 / FGSC A1120 / IAM 13836 / NRRL 3357 / JCM 12722 / SRRC 167) TaxID=332952 RepID=A0A7U2MQT2_ASPFN|nr:hypothetical protein F9C07_780 [Aspergillus flavus]
MVKAGGNALGAQRPIDRAEATRREVSSWVGERMHPRIIFAVIDNEGSLRMRTPYVHSVSPSTTLAPSELS